MFHSYLSISAVLQIYFCLKYKKPAFDFEVGKYFPVDERRIWVMYARNSKSRTQILMNESKTGHTTMNFDMVLHWKTFQNITKGMIILDPSSTKNNKPNELLILEGNILETSHHSQLLHTNSRFGWRSLAWNHPAFLSITCGTRHRLCLSWWLTECDICWMLRHVLTKQQWPGTYREGKQAN